MSEDSVGKRAATNTTTLMMSLATQTEQQMMDLDETRSESSSPAAELRLQKENGELKKLLDTEKKKRNQERFEWQQTLKKKEAQILNLNEKLYELETRPPETRPPETHPPETHPPETRKRNAASSLNLVEVSSALTQLIKRKIEGLSGNEAGSSTNQLLDQVVTWRHFLELMGDYGAEEREKTNKKHVRTYQV